MTSEWNQELASLVAEFVAWNSTPEGEAFWGEIYHAFYEKRECKLLADFTPDNWDKKSLPAAFRMDRLEKIYTLNNQITMSSNTYDNWFTQSKKWALWRVVISRIYFKINQPPIIQFLIEVANQD